MLRFILIILVMAVILTVTQNNPYIGFAIWIFLVTTFMAYTINVVDHDDIKYERDMLKTNEGRRKYFLLNSL